LLIPPTAEPIDLAYVRDFHLRVTNDDVEDAYLDRLISVARRQGESFTGRAWMPQTWAMILPAFPRVIRIPKPPLIDLVSITYFDGDDMSQTVDSSTYRVSRPSGPLAKGGTVTPVDTWPTTATRPDAVRVTFEAGYVDGSSPPGIDVPEDLVHGMLLIIGELYKQRSVSVTLGFGSQSAALISAQHLWVPYRYEVALA
jgi:uncharacterized phiE125 gp8 family phage protein